MKSGLALKRLRAAMLVSSALSGGVALADADGFAPITPYRPSVSNPAQLSAPGQLELEFGGLRQHNADSTRDSLPYLFKLAFDQNWGFLLGGEAHVWQHDASGRAQGLGDTTLTLKRAWVMDEASAFGAEFTVKLPTANDAIGSGKKDWELNTIYSRDFGPVHMDANLNALRLGAVDPGTGRTQWGGSASFSTELSDRWGVTGEWSGTRRSGAPSGTQLLAALTFSPTKFLTFDLGAARATHPGPATTMLFTGVVMPLAKFW